MYDDRTHLYINGSFVSEFLGIDKYPALNFVLYPSEGVSASFDNFEFCKFGDGSGNYSGVLNTFKNSSLDILDLFGGNK